MDHVDAAVERLGLAEEQERGARDEPGVHPFDALEEDDLDLAGIIGNHDREAVDAVVLALVGGEFRAVLGVEADFPDRADDLHVGLVGMEVGDFLDGAAVDVAERVQMHQVSHRLHRQLALKERRPPRTHAGQELDVHFHRRLHHIAKIINLS